MSGLSLMYSINSSFNDKPFSKVRRLTINCSLGSMKFNLKDVAKTMVTHGMIQSNWNFNGPENGLSAMLEAINYYKYMECPNRTPEDDEVYRKLILSIIDNSPT